MNFKQPKWLSKTHFPFESKFINIDGNTIHYIDEGKGNETILFAHPPVGWLFIYREFIKVLSKKYRCIAFDFPGFGFSEPKKEYTYTLASQASLAEGFIKKLHLENLYVLGLDTGGPSVFTAATKMPEKIKGLLLTDTLPFPVSEYPKIGKMLGIVGSPVFSFLNVTFNLLPKLTFNFGVKNRKLSKEEKQAYIKAFNTSKKRRVATKILLQLKLEDTLMQQLKLAFTTTFSNTPILLMYGENDPLTELGIPQKAHQLFNITKLVFVEGEGHFPHEGEPIFMAKQIDLWIEENKLVNV
jgi:haloalkane dehalogenase